ncbi:uncharacterized protein LOC106645585 [Copidosoma floridanum]|uniref:uncharacterized protein LOC106645585 n=1 Tax=Copidosoma floridanum TaxID=29053 RepID=UPI0006C9C795|nr:uncharacterized protein LOC106645585 [Copidosoma floridanum]
MGMGHGPKQDSQDFSTSMCPMSKGLDYAGPISVRPSKIRGNCTSKGYIVLFDYFTTRAIHLKLVSDLTSAAFIAAFRRFVSRREPCKRLFSDNATTFHGADHELKDMFHRAYIFYQRAAAVLANDGTTWSFIPPSSPHCGGLWKAGVKSTKHHLKRTIGEHALTYEELYTLLTKIEACLNSRPLTPLAEDANDLQALTLAHLLIGESSFLIPGKEHPDVPLTRLNCFQLLQRLKTDFRKRWSEEYLQQLQKRNKWRSPTTNLAVGSMVLVRDERYPPA